MDLFSSLDTHIPPRLPSLGLSNGTNVSSSSSASTSFRTTKASSSSSSTTAPSLPSSAATSTSSSAPKTTLSNDSKGYNRAQEERLRDLLNQPMDCILELPLVETLFTRIEHESKYSIEQEKASIGFQYRKQHQHYQQQKDTIQYTVNDKGEVVSTFQSSTASSSSSSSSVAPSVPSPTVLFGLGTTQSYAVAHDPLITNKRLEYHLWSLVNLLWKEYIPHHFRLYTGTLPQDYSSILAALPSNKLTTPILGTNSTATAVHGNPNPTLSSCSLTGTESTIAHKYRISSLSATSLPADSRAHDREIMDALLLTNSSYNLLSILQYWLQDTAIEDTNEHVLTMDGKTHYSIPLMWKDTANTYKINAIDPDAYFRSSINENDKVRLVFSTASPSSLSEGTENTPNPNATSSNHLRLTPQDFTNELRLYSGLWQLIRTGQMDKMAELCERYGQPWLTSALSVGYEPWQDGEIPIDDNGLSSTTTLIRAGNPFLSTFLSSLERISTYTSSLASLPSTYKELFLYRQGIMYTLHHYHHHLLNQALLCSTFEDALWNVISASKRYTEIMHCTAYKKLQTKYGYAAVPYDSTVAYEEILHNVTKTVNKSTSSPTFTPPPSTLPDALRLLQQHPVWSPYFSTSFGQILTGILHFVSSDDIDSPLKLIRMFHSFINQLPIEYRQAMEGNHNYDKYLFSPISPDIYTPIDRSPVDEGTLPLIHFLVHFAVFLRDNSIYSTYFKNPQYGTYNANVLVDDLLYIYAHHLGSLQIITTVPVTDNGTTGSRGQTSSTVYMDNRIGVSSDTIVHLLLVCCRMQSIERAKRTLLAYLYSLPPDTSVIDTLVIRRIDIFQIIDTKFPETYKDKAKQLFVSALRHTVFIQILLDEPTFLDIAVNAVIVREKTKLPEHAAALTDTEEFELTERAKRFVSDKAETNVSELFTLVGLLPPVLPYKYAQLGLSLYDYHRVLAVGKLLDTRYRSPMSASTVSLTPPVWWIESTVDTLISANMLTSLFIIEAGMLEGNLGEDIRNGSSTESVIKSILIALQLLWGEALTSLPSLSSGSGNTLSTLDSGSPSVSQDSRISIVSSTVLSTATEIITHEEAVILTNRNPQDLLDIIAEAYSWAYYVKVLQFSDDWEGTIFDDEMGNDEDDAFDNRSGYYSSARSSVSGTQSAFSTISIRRIQDAYDSACKLLQCINETLTLSSEITFNTEPGWYRSVHTVPLLQLSMDHNLTDLSNEVGGDNGTTTVPASVSSSSTAEATAHERSPIPNDLAESIQPILRTRLCIMILYVALRTSNYINNVLLYRTPDLSEKEKEKFLKYSRNLLHNALESTNETVLNSFLRDDPDGIEAIKEKRNRLIMELQKYTSDD